MKGRKRTVSDIVLIVFTTLLVVLLLSATGNAENRFNSQGKIVFDNKTQDTADDVIFDASDFNRLSTVCR